MRVDWTKAYLSEPDVGFVEYFMKSFPVHYSYSYFEYFRKGTKIGYDGLWNMNVCVSKQGVKSVLKNLKHERENADLALTHREERNYQQDLACYKSGLEYAIFLISKILEQNKHEKKDGLRL